MCKFRIDAGQGIVTIMDVILIVLGIMGFGAIVISAYVFMAAARNYVSDEHKTTHRGNLNKSAQRPLVVRSPTDRRSGRPVAFPLAVNGILIALDRRILSDRRTST
jgi:hypothetical protein